jgi:hypothetical protein
VRLAVYLPLLAPALAAPFARPLSARLDPRHATWLLTAAALILAAASTSALGLLTLDALVRVPLVARLGHWSLAVVRGNDPASVTVAYVAGALLIACCGAVGLFAARQVRALRASFAEAACLPDTGLIVVDETAADAYALPGRPGRIVVSAGMLEALDEPGRTALLAHERAHLDHHHYAYTSAARLAAVANPLLWPLAAAVEYTVERWADEQAAHVVGDRRQVAVTIARAAIATKSRQPKTRIGLALGAVFGRAGSLSLSGAGPVPRRVAALLEQAPGRRLLLIAAGVAMLALTCACLLEAANDLQDLLSLAHRHVHG